MQNRNYRCCKQKIKLLHHHINLQSLTVALKLMFLRLESGEKIIIDTRTLEYVKKELIDETKFSTD